MIRVTNTVVIPYEELRFITSRSSGPGGQHVNTSDTRVTLLFDVDASAHLTEYQKTRIRDALGSRMDKRGVLSVTSQSHRSQKRNKDETIERFIELLKEALRPVRKRRKTKVPPNSRRKRLDSKKRTGDRKRQRRRPSLNGDY